MVSDIAVSGDSENQHMDRCVICDEAKGIDMPSGLLLKRLHVHPSAWSQGIGTALHDHALATATQNGADRINLWVLEGNGRAREMYERRNLPSPKCVDDRWADLAIASMSLDWNFEEGLHDEFFDAYGIKPDAGRIRYYRELWQLES